jgi:hypothetical protein
MYGVTGGRPFFALRGQSQPAVGTVFIASASWFSLPDRKSVLASKERKKKGKSRGEEVNRTQKERSL